MGEGLVQIQPRDSYSLVEANLRCLRKLQLTESKSKSLSAVTMDATNFYTQFDSVMGENILNLVMGAPSESMLKMAASKFQQATIARMEGELPQWLMHYGAESGDGKFLTAMATFLSEEYGAPVAREDLVTTAGASMGLVLLANLLFTSSDLVFVENPTYFVATKVIGLDSGMTMVPVATDSGGINTDELEKALESKVGQRQRELTDRRPFWGMLYLVSTIHNPTGVSLTTERCRRVVELARKYNLLVVCDDVYNLLYFGDKPPHRLFQFDKKSDPDYKGNVVSNGTFSKVFGPGCRIGWLEAPKRVKEIVLSSGYMSSSGGWNHTMSGIMGSVINSGSLKEMLQIARPLYQEQCQMACEVLRTQLPGASFVEPHGGYFLWVRLPGNISGEEVAKRLKEQYNTLILNGSKCSITGDFKDCLRVTYSFNSKDRVRQGVENLVKVVKAMQAETA
ncbi:uncharacterized protein LOC135350394 [Halichondria panicea]|uniref:uncharacterized protein LOC135350394 n=1 Tax=Halichondria panicea TaxID=6063 RepID=UPI00312B7D96